MAWTFDPSTDLGKARLLITDTDTTRQIMADEDLNAFIAMAGHYMPGAAMALDSIAANEALCEKALNIMGLSTDGPAVAKVLMLRAERIRKDYQTYSTSNLGFATAEMPAGVFTLEEMIQRQYGVEII